MRTHREQALEPAPFPGSGWQRYVFPLVWLVYLAEVAHGVQVHSTGAAQVAGFVVLGAFVVVYALAGPAGWQQRRRTFWACYAAGVALTVIELFFAHQSAFVFCVYLCVLTVASGTRWGLAIVCVYAAATMFLPVVIGWSDQPDWSTGFTVLLVSLAMYGFFHLIRTNRALSAARAEVARLAAEGERSRIARDLHDLLGHSLTTITVKAGLARRLAEYGDNERAHQEIAEVEQLSRRTLGDVRAAVAGHREVTLAGELATTREVLRAAAISAELPGSVDVVDPALQEVFGWVLREGVTNMVRHAHATTCSITLGPRWIEIADSGNGSGQCDGKGSGLRGLRERLEAVGGTVTATPGYTGFRLRAEVPADGAAVNTTTADVSPTAAPSTDVTSPAAR